MAKYNSPFTVSGPIGQATFADNNGTPTARMRRGMSTRTWQTSRKLRSARNQSAAFSAASRLAAHIHHQLDNDLRRLLGPHYHNRITRAILLSAPQEAYRRVPGFPAARTAAGLRQLDLGHLPPEGTAPLASTQHHTLTQKVTVHGLQRLRDSLPLRKGELLQYRILTAHVRVPAAVADPMNPGTFLPDPGDTHGRIAITKTPWTPAVRLPETTELDAPHQDNTVLIVAVEWRAIRGLRIRYFRRHDMVRVAAAHTGTRPKDLPWLRHENPGKRKPQPKAGPNRVPPAPVTLTPKEAKAIRELHRQALEEAAHRAPIPLL